MTYSPGTNVYQVQIILKKI